MRIVFEENQYGYMQSFEVDEDTLEQTPVCSQCYVMVMPNQGRGCLCSKCESTDLIESEMNYYEF